VALRSTRRFRHKFVTSVLYKSLWRETWCSILFIYLLLNFL
jgi:hypothetical protein